MISLKSINRESRGVCVVTLEQEDLSTRSFRFFVEEGDIEVVTCETDFDVYMRFNPRAVLFPRPWPHFMARSA